DESARAEHLRRHHHDRVFAITEPYDAEPANIAELTIVEQHIVAGSPVECLDGHPAMMGQFLQIAALVNVAGRDQNTIGPDTEPAGAFGGVTQQIHRQEPDEAVQLTRAFW
ncbi:MAG: hypothetical protein JWQ51_177, partial [Tardiphaga sp.]|nr:hypothetical protein [Tardiphaga sp.]